jgi:hypothetical protein
MPVSRPVCLVPTDNYRKHLLLSCVRISSICPQGLHQHMRASIPLLISLRSLLNLGSDCLGDFVRSLVSYSDMLFFLFCWHNWYATEVQFILSTGMPFRLEHCDGIMYCSVVTFLWLCWLRRWTILLQGIFVGRRFQRNQMSWIRYLNPTALSEWGPILKLAAGFTLKTSQT